MTYSHVKLLYMVLIKKIIYIYMGRWKTSPSNERVSETKARE